MKRILCFASLIVLSCALVVRAQSTERFLKSGDVVVVFVFHVPNLTVKAAVTDGKIDLPLLGKVQAEGLSPTELKQLIEGRYKKYIDTPHVTVVLESVSK